MAAVTSGTPHRFRVPDGPRRTFWERFFSGVWEPATLAILDRLLAPGARFIDIGAWIGPTALHAAALGAEVLAFEPDPVAAAELRAALALNPDLAPRIELVEAALWTKAGTLALHSRALGDSESSVFALIERKGRLRPLGETAAVPALDAREVFSRRRLGEASLSEASLVKIDVEGAEYALLPHLPAHLAEGRPPLLLSLHPDHLGAELAEPEERERLRTACSLRVLDALPGYRPHRREGMGFTAVDADALRAGVAAGAALRGTWLFCDASAPRLPGREKSLPRT